MKRGLRKLAGAGCVVGGDDRGWSGHCTEARRHPAGGSFRQPSSMSMFEESTLAANRPTMSVFNNLVMFDQQVAQNSPKSIVSDLAMQWAWNARSAPS